MGGFKKTGRRQSMAERRPSTSYSPSVIPHLSGLEKPQEHSLNLDHCDVLIMGTGLSESILAAALSWQGVEVLHIDNADYYGDSSSTLTIDQVKKWSLDVNQGKIKHFKDAQVYIPGGKYSNDFKSKDYGIDLTPKIMFAKSDLLTLLIKSRVYKYLEFQSLSNFHIFQNDNFNKKISNTTKGDIFTDQSLSLTTKRYLMKFLKFVLQDNNDPDKINIIKQNSQTPIEQFLAEKFKLEPPQIDELIYSIGLCTKVGTRTPEALSRIKRFLVSFDVYGNFPVMVSKYGGPGEISQGFCRSAAVAGTVYKLDTSLSDFDPQSKIAKFSDGSQVKINEKLIISPTQVPKFLQSDYNEISQNLKKHNVTRLISIVRKDCKEWMGEHESSSIVVFPPGSLPTNNEEVVQVIIQNSNAGVCPPGQCIWFSQTDEQDINKAKSDLQAAFEKLEAAILRESSPSDLEDILNDDDFVMTAQGTPVLVNSFKLGMSLQNFVPKEKLEIVCKIGYVQESFVRTDLSNVLNPNESNNISCATLKDAPDIYFTNMPSSELSYDGIVSDCKALYSRITGTDEDFFDVDFEDEEEDEYTQSGQTTGVARQAGSVRTSVGDESCADNAIADSDEDDGHHEPFGASEMEL